MSTSGVAQVAVVAQTQEGREVVGAAGHFLEHTGFAISSAQIGTTLEVAVGGGGAGGSSGGGAPGGTNGKSKTAYSGGEGGNAGPRPYSGSGGGGGGATVVLVDGTHRT